MVEQQPSKLNTWVRFPSPAPPPDSTRKNGQERAAPRLAIRATASLPEGTPARAEAESAIDRRGAQGLPVCRIGWTAPSCGTHKEFGRPEMPGGRRGRGAVVPFGGERLGRMRRGPAARRCAGRGEGGPVRPPGSRGLDRTEAIASGSRRMPRESRAGPPRVPPCSGRSRRLSGVSGRRPEAEGLLCETPDEATLAGKSARVSRARRGTTTSRHQNGSIQSGNRRARDYTHADARDLLATLAGIPAKRPRFHPPDATGGPITDMISRSVSRRACDRRTATTS